MIEIAPDIDVDVVFARSLLHARQAGLSDPAVVVLPDQNNWNDYGWRTFAQVAVLIDGRVEGPEPIRLMVRDEQTTAVALDRLFQQQGPVVRVEQSDLTFLSLLPSPERYTALLALLGFDRSVVALRKLGDAALARLEGPTDAQSEMLVSAAFWHGMLRADDGFGAYQRGLRILRRRPREQVRDAATSFMLHARLPTAAEPYRVNFDFEPDTFGRNRISVLIGRNGVGKTQLLRRLVEGLRAERGADADDVWMEPRPPVSRVLAFSSVVSDPYERAIPPWEEIDYEYFPMTAPAREGSDSALQALVSVRRDHGNRIGEAQLQRAGVLEDILDRFGLWRGLVLPLQPARDDYRFRGEFNWDGRRWLSFHERQREEGELLVGRDIDWESSPVVFADGRPRQLSSGETAILRFAAQAVAAIDQGSLLLFDEPETHLHPNYVSDFMEILQGLLERTHSVAIIATHSAYVVREVPRERVGVMSVEDGLPVTDRPRLQTFGASIDSISQFVFGDGGVSHWHLERLREWVAGPGGDLTIGEIIDRHGDELNPETLSFIAELKRGTERGE